LAKNHNFMCNACWKKSGKEWEKKNRSKGTKKYANRLKKIRENRKRRRKDLLNRFGNQCLFGKHPWHLRFHNKKGLKHANWMDVEKKPEDYALICEACHKHVHWCYKTLPLSWGEVISLFKAKEEFYLQAPAYIADHPP
jgi:predicted HNH restriction endonuclease